MSSFKNPNYKMPPEWAEHRATWLAWPYDEDTFPNRVEKAEQVVVQIISSLHTEEEIELIVLNEEMQSRASTVISGFGIDATRISCHITEYADIWLRDCGPIFVRDNSGNVIISNWDFNSWGNKFPELLIDGEIPEKISKWKKQPLVNTNFVLEGGAIEVNGEGICLTTEQCLLNKNRNPGTSKDEIEQLLKNCLGIEKTIWLKQGLTNDHTDGHIDELVRFVAPQKIVCGFEENPEDENYNILKDNYRVLLGARNLEDNPFEVIKLPMPHLNYEDGSKAPVSYTNFYIGNKVVLAPTFKDKNDSAALEILKTCFPERKVIGIDCSDLIYGGGAIHCITQQEPV